MSYSSPTIIYKLDLLNGFVSVCDVSGTYAVQTYRTEQHGRTSLLNSEVWNNSEDAMDCAHSIHEEEEATMESNERLGGMVGNYREKLGLVED